MKPKQRHVIWLCLGAWLATSAPATAQSTTELYRINSGTYITIGSLAGSVANELPNANQTFLELRYRFDQGRVEMRILGEDLQSQFRRFTGGTIQGGQVLFSNQTFHPLYPIVRDVATLNYAVPLGDASVRLSGSIQSKPVCCDIPHTFLHTNVHATILPGPPPSPVGVYDYRGFDPHGNLIVTGLLAVTSPRDPIEGTWFLRGVNDPVAIGPQLGRGILAGTVYGANLSIDFNPGYNDNNVILNGDLAEDTYRGRWSYVTMLGLVTNGTFVADKKTFLLSAPRGDRDRFSFSLEVGAGIVYAVESAEALDSPTWTELTRSTGSGEIIRVADTNRVSPTRFYRIRIIDPTGSGGVNTP